MLLRNYIELGILAAALVAGLVLFFVLRHKASCYESELVVKRREELRGKLD